MSVKVLHKFNQTAGKVPAAADLTLREIAVNTADGKAFLKTAANQVVTLNPDFKVWVDGTLYQQSQLVEWIGTGVSDANGRVTVFPTQNGTLAGPVIFSRIISVSHEVWLTNGANATATQIAWFNYESATTTRVVLRGTTGRTMLLLGDSVQFAPAGISVRVSVRGLP